VVVTCSVGVRTERTVVPYTKSPPTAHHLLFPVASCICDGRRGFTYFPSSTDYFTHLNGLPASMANMAIWQHGGMGEMWNG
jgi:hypothetical protein